MPRHVGLLRILQLVELLRQSSCTLAELSKEFGVTERTIRRDLDLLNRTHLYAIRQDAFGYHLSSVPPSHQEARP